jgi:hypothetical protein
VSGLSILGLLIVSGVLGFVMFVHGWRYWSAASFGFPLGFGGLAVGLVTTPFWMGLIAATFGALVGGWFLVQGQDLYETIVRRTKSTRQNAATDSPDLPGNYLIIGVAGSALLLAIGGALDYPVFVEVIRAVLLVLLALCYWLSYRRIGKPRPTGIAEPG